MFPLRTGAHMHVGTNGSGGMHKPLGTGPGGFPVTANDRIQSTPGGHVLRGYSAFSRLFCRSPRVIRQTMGSSNELDSGIGLIFGLAGIDKIIFSIAFCHIQRLLQFTILVISVGILIFPGFGMVFIFGDYLILGIVSMLIPFSISSRSGVAVITGLIGLLPLLQPVLAVISVVFGLLAVFPLSDIRCDIPVLIIFRCASAAAAASASACACASAIAISSA